MTLPAHVAIGLVLGKLTGNFPLALVGALAIDLDHLISYLRHGVLFHWGKLISVLRDQNDPWGDQRNFLHSIFVWLLISGIWLSIDFSSGLPFVLGYLSHLILDALDQADFYPLYPLKIVNLRGPIPYFSFLEILFTGFLVILFFLV